MINLPFWITGEFVYFIRCHNRPFEFILFIAVTYDALRVEGCVVHQ